MDDSTIITTRPVSLSTQTPLQSISLTEWGPVEIENWLNRLGFEHELISKFTSNNIIGESLPYLTDEHFKEMEIAIEDRIRLKIEINKLVVEHGYIKNNEDELKLILTNINELIQTQLDSVTRSLNDELFKLKEDINSNKFSKPLPTPDKNYPSSPFNLSSPTKQVIPNKSPNSTDSHIQRRPSEANHSKSARNSSLFQTSTISTLTTPHSPTTLKPQSSSSSFSLPAHTPVSEPLKQLRASTDDPCSKILQAAMKRHKLNDADWRNYALVICYGDKERILELDEKPVMIFKELRDRGEHPAIMLRQKADYNVGGSSQTPGGKL